MSVIIEKAWSGILLPEELILPSFEENEKKEKSPLCSSLSQKKQTNKKNSPIAVLYSEERS